MPNLYVVFNLKISLNHCPHSVFPPHVYLKNNIRFLKELVMRNLVLQNKPIGMGKTSELSTIMY